MFTEMKSLEEFIILFTDQLEETDASTINPSTEFHNLDEWSSLTALAITSMISEEFGVSISGNDLKELSTIEELYNTVVKSEK